MPRFRGFVAVALLAAGCASAPPPTDRVEQTEQKALALPATYMSTPGCPGCLAVTMTLRPDGSFLAREQLGAAEFYDFGRWRIAGDTLELGGGRNQRRYSLSTLRRAPAVQALRGPFRLVGIYDGTTFKECLTGIAWQFTDTRAAAALRQRLQNEGTGSAMVALDAQFEGSPEKLRVVRAPALLNVRSCPG